MSGCSDKAGYRSHDSSGLESLTDIAQFTDFSSEIDLTNLDGYLTQPARALKVDTIGTVGTGDILVVKTLDSNAKQNTRTIIVHDGDCFDVQLVAISVVTTVTRITVVW